MANRYSRDFHNLDTDELGRRLVEAQSELTNLRFGLVTRKTQNTAGLVEARRQIARLKTILHEREQEA